ncbi:hypothetical protein CLV81_3001 [Flagellimonas meridianipacifica]|uniref:Uncharacterized protein n=1 Tax=Flagellimonas meridianipacifica TaxID=1080225 RepID=A0A2T0MAS9_9FLAO|nr:hypothetical protein CLV81_3001 [Allomuricauda pacifica]
MGKEKLRTTMYNHNYSRFDYASTSSAQARIQSELLTSRLNRNVSHETRN